MLQSVGRDPRVEANGEPVMLGPLSPPGVVAKAPRAWLAGALYAIALCLGANLAQAGDPAPTGKALVYVGTYTGPGPQSEGIYAFRLDGASGRLEPLGLAARLDDPSFLAIHPDRDRLFAVSEVGEYAGAPTGSLSAFSLDRQSGELTRINTVGTGGAAPCHVSVAQDGRSVLVANYTGGSVAAFPVAEDGSLGEAATLARHEGESVNPQRQQAPHAHSIRPSPDGRFAIAADLGTDELVVYSLGPEPGSLARHGVQAASPGAGPRHLAFALDGRFVYVINELDSTVAAYTWDSEAGTLTPRQTVSTLPQGFDGASSTAEVAVHPSGRFLYGSNRGHDSLAVFAIDAKTGDLASVGHVPVGGRTPRHFAIDPSGRWLLAAGQKSHDLAIFRVDPKSGLPHPTGERHDVHSPVCVSFLPLE